MVSSRNVVRLALLKPQAQGIEMIMLTGDNTRTAHAIAQEAGITDVRAEQLPATGRIVARLEAQGHMLGMPHSRQLGDGLRELRFTCEGVARRITYVLDPDRRAVTLTTFRKQRNNERGEILRARRAQARHRGREELMSTPFRELEAASLAAMTADERARFDAALEEEEARLALAEMVYQARTAAGLTQAALAERVGSKQSVISAIENGSQQPTIATLRRIARAVDRHLTIDLAVAN